MVSRHAILALLAVVTLGGCKASSFDAASRAPEPIALAPTLDPQEIISRSNENARRITSVRAESAIKVETLGDRRTTTSARGRLALEPPRNFRLMLDSPATGLVSVADLGSNDSEFWFWTKDKSKTLYVCDYDPSGSSPLASALQPDWIVESMGLREITEDEAANVKAKQNGTYTILTLQRKGPDGTTLIKETWVDTASRRIVEHRLYGMQGTQRVPLAQAVIGKVKEVFPEAGKGEDGESSPLLVPEQVRLTWFQQQLRMDIQLSDVRLNVKFSDVMRANLFTVPTIRNAERKNLKDLPEFAVKPPTVRESRPVPTSQGAAKGGRVRLGEPEPIGMGGAKRLKAAPAPLGPDFQQARLPETVVGARIPTAPEAFSAEVETWKTASSNPSMER